MHAVGDVCLCLVVDAARIPVFFQLLAQGFLVRAKAGGGVRAFITEGLGIHEEYLEEKIHTVFLNGRVVDDLESTKVEEGSVLALSAAMPGAAGAVLRMDSHYARMRSQVTHKGRGSLSAQDQAVTVRVKLFNVIASDLGPSLLDQGIYTSGEDLQSFLRARWDDIRAGVRKAWLDEKEIESGRLCQLECKGRIWFLQVRKSELLDVGKEKEL